MTSFTLSMEPFTDPRDAPGSWRNYKQETAFQVLKDHLEDGGKLPLEEAFRKLYGMLPTTGECNGEEGWDTAPQPSWEERNLCLLIVEAARQIPYLHSAQMKLVRLVERLAKSDRFLVLAHPRQPTGYELGTALNSIVLGEEYHILHAENTPFQYLNLIAFLARLTVAGFVPNNNGYLGDMKRLEGETGRIRSSDLSAAAIWVVYAGQYIFNKVVLTPPTDTDTGYYQYWYAAKGLYKAALGRRRWDSWQRRMVQLCENMEVDFDDEARALGRKAADIMASLSGNVE